MPNCSQIFPRNFGDEQPSAPDQLLLILHIREEGERLMFIYSQLMFQPGNDQANPQKKNHNDDNDHNIIVLSLIFIDGCYEVVLVFVNAGCEDAVDGHSSAGEHGGLDEGVVVELADHVGVGEEFDDHVIVGFLVGDVRDEGWQ